MRLRLSSLVLRRARGDLICMYKVEHGLSMGRSFCCPNPLWISRSCFQYSSTAVQHPTSPMCLKRSSNSVLGQIVRGVCKRFVSGKKRTLGLQWVEQRQNVTHLVVVKGFIIFFDAPFAELVLCLRTLDVLLPLQKSVGIWGSKCVTGALRSTIVLRSCHVWLPHVSWRSVHGNQLS